MYGLQKLKWTHYLEIIIHLGYWLFHFTSVNTSWDLDWTNRWDRRGVSQLTVLLYPVIFYLNAFWLIPKLLKGNQWYRYFIISSGFLLGVEVVRTIVFVSLRNDPSSFEVSFQQEFMSNDSLIFGLPNSLIFAFIFSSIYRFTRDWVRHQSAISRLQSEKDELNKSFEIMERSFKASVSSVNGSFKNTFQAKRRDGIFILRVENISHIKAQGDFVLAFDDAGDSYIINHKLSVMEELLDPQLFFKINRSEMVNAGFIRKFTNYTKNRLEIQLRNSEDALYTSNSRTPEFRKWIDDI